MKNGLSFKAKIVALGCKAIYHAYCPWEARYPALAHTAVVIPTHTPHTHPPPPENKINQPVARLYLECARKLGSSATPPRVDRAPTTIALLGTTPALFHPALANRDIRLRLIKHVKEELDGPERTGDVRTQVAVYLAQQQALPPAERYLQSSITRDGRTIIFGIHPELIKNIHRVRTLDCDTTFKPVVGSMEIFEINAWLAAINEVVTLGRVWMEAHDRTIFKQVWEELQRLVVVLTGRPLLFKGLHSRHSSDLPTPFCRPLTARSFVEWLLMLEPCCCLFSASATPIFFEVSPDAPHLSKDDHNRIKGFVHPETPQAVEDFKVWIATIPDPDGAITRWWKQKITHFWLLPAAIQCLSRIPLNDWHTMPATTNLGEAQHARNNAETGTQMGIIESFKKSTCLTLASTRAPNHYRYAEYDARRAAEIKVKLATGNLNHNQNELVHRYASSNRRHAAAADKGMRARDADEHVIALRQAKLQVEAELKQAVAESKSNSSGRVPARCSSKDKKAEEIAQGMPNVEQVPRRSSGRVASRSTEPERNAHQEDELQDPQPEKDGQVFQTSDEPSGPRHLRSRGAMVSPTEPPTSARGGGPSNTKRKSTSSATAPAPKPKRRKAGDPLSGWAIELVPGDKTTAVTPREYAQKEPEEFAAQYPQYLKFL
ncbi:hypothetical protein MVEN_00707900 [Mycena venus]|uniref:Uncharacterized protein n=1 Tax=Mycena venus TaxID=2733690 RepID=A0A8H6YK92_9AGAR|nr:hypothetical protein MVEN_00707900 [Mycena venus]